ncbi:MAG TPA: endonuclease III [Firmicutes bacterium]|nr:endonuclease III [Bacillota bacterium]
MLKHLPELLRALAATYPVARTALVYRSPFELLVATMLSAQTTDKQVNRVTPVLFAHYPTPEALAKADPAEVAADIAGVGLHHTKARHLVAAARVIVDSFAGRVPERLEDLLTLPGVGRKTAKVVLANAFNTPALAVDTHVFRLAHRLGLSTGRTPREVETDLEALIPPSLWIATHHRLIEHGRRICRARRPRCSECCLASHCRYRQEAGEPSFD